MVKRNTQEKHHPENHRKKQQTHSTSAEKGSRGVPWALALLGGDKGFGVEWGGVEVWLLVVGCWLVDCFDKRVATPSDPQDLREAFLA